MEFEEWVDSLTEQDKVMFLREWWDGFGRVGRMPIPRGVIQRILEQRESDGGGQD